MVSTAKIKYLRISPKKLAVIARLIGRKRVDKALFILLNTNKKGAKILKSVIESALSNAKRVPEKKYTEENLYISKLHVNPGPVLKRFRAMSLGRAGMIRKRTSHVTVELEVLHEAKAKEKEKSEKPVKKKRLIKMRKK